LAAVIAASGSDSIEIYLGTLVSDSITSSVATEGGGESKSYSIYVREGIERYVYLANSDGNLWGIWNADEEDYIIEAGSATGGRTVSLTFSQTDNQKLFVRTLNPDAPESFTFKIYVP